jgi:hypothetical protein
LCFPASVSTQVRGDFVPDTLGGDLALELGKGQQNVKRQPPHRFASHKERLVKPVKQTIVDDKKAQLVVA